MAALTSFSMRLLSFLNDIETALKQQASATPGPAWDVSRMVNYHQNLARMTLAPISGSPDSTRSGAILLQSFPLADGSLCIKASLSWEHETAQPVIAVYAKPQVNWAAEAARIAGAWLAGPAASAVESAASTEAAL